MSKQSYLDHNATAPLRPEARAALLAALDLDGNPSSIHRPGRAARGLIEEARGSVARLVAASPEEVVFTSGATEANNLCLAGAPAASLLASAGEHDSVLAAAEARTVPLTPDGRIDLQALDRLLSDAEPPCLLSLMAANNETGVLQPLVEAAGRVRDAGGRLHLDAVQAAGRLPPEALSLGDYVSLSSHKLGGPKGVGALVLRDEAALAASIKGGGQERRLRAGTENVAAIAGFAAAAEAALAERAGEQRRLGGLRDRFERDLHALAPDAVVFGAAAPRLANTSCFAVPGTRAETLLISLDLAGVYLSSGSACSSGKVARSHVLAAMGVEDRLAGAALRLSLGWNSGEAEVTHCLEALAALLAKPRQAVA